MTIRGVGQYMIVVNPNHRNRSPQAAIEPPIWCAMIAGWLRDKYKEVSILDAEAEELTTEETAERIRLSGDGSAIILVMGANPSASSTPKMPIAYKLRELLKPSCKVYFTGLHPQVVLEEKLKKDFTLWRFQMGELSEVTPAWDLIDLSKYRAHNWHCLDGRDKGNYGVVYSSFGCPFNCHYCNIHSLYSGITYRKPQDVVDEIGYLVSRGVKNLKFCDELFVLDKKRVNRICELLEYRNYDLNIWAYARVDTVNPEILKNLKRAGFNWLCYGFEASSLEGDKYKSGLPFRAREMTREAGINVIGNFMFGLPSETMEDMENTQRLANELQCEYANFYVALPYPGSKWYDSLEDKPTDWSSYNQFGENMCADPKVIEFRDKVFNQYFSNYDYQTMIKNKFGAHAVDHIGEMLKWSPREMLSSVNSLS